MLERLKHDGDAENQRLHAEMLTSAAEYGRKVDSIESMYKAEIETLTSRHRLELQVSWSTQQYKLD